MSTLQSVSDIFNRPPAIAEDTLQYTIYPPAELEDKASATTFAACFQRFAESLLTGFIWHRDGFEVKVVPNPEDKEKWILEGRMRVGDCVDDEWCVVWLLREISSKWDVVISVYDSDGEFLLIEAADALPSWVQPSNSENRVWIYRSRLHLIPLTHISPPPKEPRQRMLPGAGESDDEGESGQDDKVYISANDGANVARNRGFDTYAPPGVEGVVWDRIASYPGALKDHVHATKAYIPAEVAKALAENPALVQRAVETFYTRDALQLRAAHKMARFSPSDTTLRAVKLTRTAYAQLVGQNFYPPKVFGRWEEREGTKEWRWRDVGMKIAVGFEMLYQESKTRQGVSAEQLRSSAEAAKDALRNNPEYITYIENLVSANYFQGEVGGSELWKVLESKAASTFIEVRRSDDATRPTFARQVDSAIASASDLPPQEMMEDGDSWLNIDEADFDAMMRKVAGASKQADPSIEGEMDVDGQAAQAPTEDFASLQASQLKNFADKVEKFVEGEGDVEGARFEDEHSDGDDEERGMSDFSEEPDSDDESVDGERMEADPPQMAAAERQAFMDKLVAPLERSEYGKMPASYSQSQRVKPTTMESEMVESTGPEDKNTKPRTSEAQRPVRAPIIPRNQYDGVVDSDDETDDGENDEDEEDRPQVVGDIEIDMDAEEEEFLEFSRQALGITDEQWNEIIKDREERGAFLPASASKPKKVTPKCAPAKSQSTSQEKLSGEERTPRIPQPGPRPNANPELDSFEAVMQALDQELAKLRPERMDQGAPQRLANSKGKEKESSIDEDTELDIDAAMEEELKEMLEKADEEDEGMGGMDAGMDYNLIKNFLESFKGQAGLAGPVGNLAGRLDPGWRIPRDQDA